MGGTSGQIRKLWVVTLAGLVSGILLGVLYAWIINPVKSLDAPINQLRPDLHEAYLRMAIDSYSVNQNILQAKARFDAVGDHRSAILAKIEANPGTQSVQSILAYAKGVQNPASGSGGTPEPVGEVTGAFRGTPGVVLALLSLGALILASVLIYYRNRAPGKASSTTQTNRERSRQVAPEIFIYSISH
jgi:hypothetical protein